MTLTASEMGKLGGKASVKKRLNGMTDKQKSDYMRKVRRGGKINETENSKTD